MIFGVVGGCCFLERFLGWLGGFWGDFGGILRWLGVLFPGVASEDFGVVEVFFGGDFGAVFGDDFGVVGRFLG